MKLRVAFFRTDAGAEPVRDWLLELGKSDRKAIGEDILAVQFRWPLGMPLVRKMDAGLWELRSHISDGRIARILFTMRKDCMVLLHGFIKKTQRTPKADIDLATRRKR
ncbi:MAG: type II toxin-antitoxin system RelE/ParE family toxin, partial [Mariprofundaceae bacterium]|nr:type II toxin-antitoxin system RelE/ParE family toxin [Mariprofundaceae bacterium]